jgi:hypothetical protein
MEDRVRQRGHHQHGLAQAAAATTRRRQSRQDLLWKSKFPADDTQTTGEKHMLGTQTKMSGLTIFLK